MDTNISTAQQGDIHNVCHPVEVTKNAEAGKHVIR